MTRRETNDAILQFFPPEVRAFIEELAKKTNTTPVVVVRERMRELAEYEKAARSIA
jgi:hypothetical protein